MKLDHIAIAAYTLDEGAAYIHEKLGVEVPLGGEHLAMGTHNRLMRLGDDVYLEIIAIAPHLPSPNRPRWFALDTKDMQDKLTKGPRLITWIARDDDIASRTSQSTVLIGDVIPMSRGTLTWEITVRADGLLPFDGLFPTLIQWPHSSHPADKMIDLGCRLKGLTLHHHAPGMLRSHLSSIGADDLVNIVRSDHSPCLSAEIDTPNGLKLLD